VEIASPELDIRCSPLASSSSWRATAQGAQAIRRWKPPPCS